MRDSVAYVAEGCQFDSAIYWLVAALGRCARVETFPINVISARPTPHITGRFHFTYGRHLLVASSTGSKADMMPVAVGAQGRRNSPPREPLSLPDFFRELDLVADGKRPRGHARQTDRGTW